MPGAPVVAFLSSGRCGTQWLTAGLRDLYSAIDAEHEPIGPLYRPRTYFRRYDDPESILEVVEVASHMRRIERASRPYVETGWPLFAALPAMAARLRGRLRVVHLTRHPVPSALSHLAHKSYAGSPRDDGYTRLATLGPDDPGVFQQGYSARWESLTPYQKCLFWWTEVHQFGIEFQHRMTCVPFLRIKSEQMLGGQPAPLQRLLEFMDLPWDERWLARTRQIVDRWHHHTDENIDHLDIDPASLTVQVTRALGYEISGLDLRQLKARYQGRPDSGHDRMVSFS